MSLREKKKIETKNKIFEVAGRLFKERGFENTTVDEITTEAGIGKGTFFNYFPTKAALLREFVKEKDEFASDLAREELGKNIPIKEKIRNILVNVAKSNEKDKEITKIFVIEYLRNYGNEERKSGGLKNLMKVLLEKGASCGEMKEGIDVKLAAENLTAIYFHSLMEWLWSDGHRSFSEDISKKIDLIFDGIGS